MTQHIELLKKDGLLVVCSWCDHAVDEGRNPIKLVTPRHQCLLQVTHTICVECKKQLDRERNLYQREITLSPLVCRRIQMNATTGS